MKQTVNFVNVRYGQMDESDGGNVWAHIHVIEDAIDVRDGFAGCDLGKITVDTSDGNKLAKSIHAAVRAGELVPGNAEFEFQLSFSLKGSKPTVVGFVPNAKLPRADLIKQANESAKPATPEPVKDKF
ncbi:hypothetical protein PVL97_07030 [Aeromonas hydrophila]|uniref:hypothetical protein n=1 Tax=Aeromonas hydrophila TaxID=644 RepID=UPI002378FB88|nr:hypothetical protein [Aeromonas hydrophila]MDD9229389.1 hypothetical protein [Aeromonas hydrophila]MDD9229402.1 hypothetical protein [Aeromonas hydrophila]